MRCAPPRVRAASASRIRARVALPTPCHTRSAPWSRAPRRGGCRCRLACRRALLSRSRSRRFHARRRASALRLAAPRGRCSRTARPAAKAAAWRAQSFRRCRRPSRQRRRRLLRRRLRRSSSRQRRLVRRRRGSPAGCHPRRHGRPLCPRRRLRRRCAPFFDSRGAALRLHAARGSARVLILLAPTDARLLLGYIFPPARALRRSPARRRCGRCATCFARTWPSTARC